MTHYYKKHFLVISSLLFVLIAAGLAYSVIKVNKVETEIIDAKYEGNLSDSVVTQPVKSTTAIATDYVKNMANIAAEYRTFIAANKSDKQIAAWLKDKQPEILALRVTDEWKEAHLNIVIRIDAMQSALTANDKRSFDQNRTALESEFNKFKQ